MTIRFLRLPWLVLLFALLAPAAGADWLPAYPGREPAPILPCRLVRAHRHDARAFTQGLFFLDGQLYETTGQYGSSSLRRVDEATGRVLALTALPDEVFGEGACPVGHDIRMLTWKSGRGFLFRSADLSLIGEYRFEPEGWGLTSSPEGILFQSRGDNVLIERDPQTFAETGRISVIGPLGPVDRLNELEWVEGKILCNIWYSDLVAVVDPDSGRVTAFLDLSPLRPLLNRDAGVANGIAWDPEGRRLLVTGKNWDSLFEVAFSPSPW